jgi:hypothetical protein
MSYINPARKVISDGKRAAAKIDLTAKCLGCGKNYTHRLTWFQANRFKCPSCGGDIDPEPMRQMMLANLRSVKSAIKRNPSE